MNSFKRFFNDRLPEKSWFYGLLKDECVCKKDYLHADNVRNAFKMQAMSDYHDPYLKTDVLLLANAFEKYIVAYLEYYGIDPCHYFSSP